MSYDDSVITCAKCERSVRLDQALKLWDTRVYCRQCIREASPSLEKVAEQSPVLWELLGGDASEEFRRGTSLVWQVLAIGGVPIWIAVCIAAGVAYPPNIVLGLMFLAGVGLLGTCVVWVMTRPSRWAITVVQVRDGIFYVRNFENQYLFAVPLEKCAWKLAKVPDIIALLPGWGRKVISVYILAHRNQKRKSVLVPFSSCGFSAQMQEVWLAFFQLAGVKKLDRKTAVKDLVVTAERQLPELQPWPLPGDAEQAASSRQVSSLSESGSYDSTSTSSGPRCAKCHGSVSDDSSIQLWDGKHYCRYCAERFDPIFLTEAVRRPSGLSEQLVPSEGQLRRHRLTDNLQVALLALAVVGFLLGGITRNEMIGMAGVMLLVVLGPWYFIRRCFGARSLPLIGGEVYLQQGILTVAFYDAGILHLPIGKVRWFLGSARRSNFPPLPFGGRAIILEFTELPEYFVRFRPRVACGLCPETRKIWQHFLEVAGVERKRRWWQGLFPIVRK